MNYIVSSFIVIGMYVVAGFVTWGMYMMRDYLGVQMDTQHYVGLFMYCFTTILVGQIISYRRRLDVVYHAAEDLRVTFKDMQKERDQKNAELADAMKIVDKIKFSLDNDGRLTGTYNA